MLIYPLDMLAEVTVKVPALVTIENELLKLTLFLSVTWIVNVLVPETVGVPETAPVVALRESPTGKEPAVTLQVYGAVPPVAANVWL